MAQNITLLGASYSDVPAVTLPKTGGGTASFTDVTDTTAAAADVAAGKYFYTAAGVRTLGTGSGGGGGGSLTQDQDGYLVVPTTGGGGGGGGGLEYEEGTFSPAEDIARPTISFVNTHTTTPVFIGLSDISTESTSVTGDDLLFSWFDPYRAFGTGYPYTENTRRYALASWIYKTSSGASFGSQMPSTSSDDTAYTESTNSRYWVTPTGFRPYAQSTSRYWRAGRTYKWIAVWAPTT